MVCGTDSPANFPVDDEHASDTMFPTGTKLYGVVPHPQMSNTAAKVKFSA